MTEEKFPWNRTILLGLGFLGISSFWPIFNQFIPLFLQAGNPEFNRQLISEGRAIPNIVGFGLAPAWALFIMTWDNLINVFSRGSAQKAIAPGTNSAEEKAGSCWVHPSRFWDSSSFRSPRACWPSWSLY
jgi:hypothetical protein